MKVHANAALTVGQRREVKRLYQQEHVQIKPLARQELGTQTWIALNPRWSLYRAAKTTYRRQMQLAFDDSTYHHRWHGESAYSQDKRILGSFLRSRSDSVREAECLLRVLTHNLMLLALLIYGFNRAHSTLNEEKKRFRILNCKFQKANI